jgi:hypothetical protein
MGLTITEPRSRERRPEQQGSQAHGNLAQAHQYLPNALVKTDPEVTSTHLSKRALHGKST